MEIKIEYLPLTALEPYKLNTRKHQQYDVKQIATSIKKYGFNDPIGIWSDHNVIVEGHGRYEAALSLGLTQVPCIRLDHLTDAQRREYGIMHNKTAELSSWDFEALNIELPQLNLDDFEIDFTLPDLTPQINEDDLTDDFTLPDGDKSELCQMTFTLHEKQKQLVEKALKIAKNNVYETFGNENSNGNALYEVVKEWEQQRI